MKQVFFATTNKEKVNSVASVLSKFNIEVAQRSLEIPEIRNENLKNIAIHKVLLRILFQNETFLVFSFCIKYFIRCFIV